MPYTANYPATVQEILRPGMKYKGDALRALKAFRRAKAWQGDLGERQEKFMTLHRALCGVYGLNTMLEFNNNSEEPGTSGNSYFDPANDRIVLQGKLSVVTYLHELGHARGWDERYACIWSVNLFARIFPRSFERCNFIGHMVVAGSPASESLSPTNGMGLLDLLNLPGAVEALANAGAS